MSPATPKGKQKNIAVFRVISVHSTNVASFTNHVNVVRNCRLIQVCFRILLVRNVARLISSNIGNATSAPVLETRN